MNKKQKEEWIIRYIKKNGMEYILSKKYKKNRSAFFRAKKIGKYLYSCISIIISVITLILTINYNVMVHHQTELMKQEQYPIIDVVVNRDIENDIDEIILVNNKNNALNYRVKVIAYIDVISNENEMGYIPIRVYFLNAYNDFQYIHNMSNEIANLRLYNNSYYKIENLTTKLHDIKNEFTNLYWDFNFNYLIEVSSIYTHDFDKVIKDYFIYNETGIHRVNDIIGEEIINEKEYMIDNGDGTATSKENFFDLDSNADIVFEYIIKKIREKDLYAEDFPIQKNVTYGKYEPE